MLLKYKFHQRLSTACFLSSLANHKQRIVFNLTDQTWQKPHMKMKLGILSCSGPRANYCSEPASSVIQPVSLSYTSFEPLKKRSDVSPIVIMHGLLGSKNNWKSLGKVMSHKTGRTVYTLDARNHGDSPHTEDLNYYALATDVQYFLESQEISSACLVGHSMGGRAMMAASLLNPKIVEKLFVLDISPVGDSGLAASLPPVIDLMRRVVIPSLLELHQARKYVDECLQPSVPETELRMFLLTNLVKQKDRFCWKVNLNAIAKNFKHIATFPLMQQGRKFDGLTFFIGGGLSDYIRHQDHDSIRTVFPKAEFHYIDGAGHWLHSNKPQEFMDVIVPLINT